MSSHQQRRIEVFTRGRLMSADGAKNTGWDIGIWIDNFDLDPFVTERHRIPFSPGKCFFVAASPLFETKVMFCPSLEMYRLIPTYLGLLSW